PRPPVRLRPRRCRALLPRRCQPSGRPRRRALRPPRPSDVAPTWSESTALRPSSAPPRLHPKSASAARGIRILPIRPVRRAQTRPRSPRGASPTPQRRPPIRLVYSGEHGIVASPRRVLEPGSFTIGRAITEPAFASLVADASVSRAHALLEVDAQ